MFKLGAKQKQKFTVNVFFFFFCFFFFFFCFFVLFCFVFFTQCRTWNFRSNRDIIKMYQIVIFLKMSRKSSISKGKGCRDYKKAVQKVFKDKRKIFDREVQRSK